ncbi:hypothetical protein D3C84_674770 [compost metagenome]
MGRFHVLRIGRNSQHVEEAAGPLFRDHIGQIDTVFGLDRPGLGLLQVTGVTDRHAQVAVGQIRNVLGGVEIGGIGADGEEQLLGLLQLVRLLAIRLEAQVLQGSRQHFGRRVEEGDTALLQLGHVLRLEHQIPGIHRRIGTQHGFHLLDVVGVANGAPQVRDGVQVARVTRFERLEQRGIQVFPVGEFGLVQLLEDASLDLLGQEGVRRNHDVIT